MSMLSTTASSVRVRVRVQPRSARDRIVGRHGDALKVQVTAPPVEGAANQAVIDLFAKWLALPRRLIAVVQGQTARDKVVEVTTDAPAALAARIENLLPGCVDKVGGSD